MEEILKYVQNQFVQAPFRMKPYIQDEQGNKYPQRNIYVKMEDIVSMTLYREFVANSRGALNYDSSKAGADFILTVADKNIIPIEVGTGEKLGTQVRNTMKKIGSATYGVVICRNSLTHLGRCKCGKGSIGLLFVDVGMYQEYLQKISDSLEKPAVQGEKPFYYT